MAYTGLSTTPARVVESNRVGAALGWSVCTAGDTNQDGFADVIVGAPLDENGQFDEGRAYVYLGSAAGLGYLILQAEGTFDIAGVFAGMFVLAVFVIVIDWVVTMIENRLLVWRPVQAETRT